MRLRLRDFRANQNGAVTVDFIVLTGAVIALGITTMGAIRAGTFEGIANITEQLGESNCVVTGGGTTDISACN